MLEEEVCHPKNAEDVPSAQCCTIGKLALKVSEPLRHPQQAGFLKVGSEKATFSH